MILAPDGCLLPNPLEFLVQMRYESQSFDASAPPESGLRSAHLRIGVHPWLGVGLPPWFREAVATRTAFFQPYAISTAIQYSRPAGRHDRYTALP